MEEEEEEEKEWVAQLHSRPRDTETVETALAPRSLARSLPPCVVTPFVVPCVVGGSVSSADPTRHSDDPTRMDP